MAGAQEKVPLGRFVYGAASAVWLMVHGAATPGVAPTAATTRRSHARTGADSGHNVAQPSRRGADSGHNAALGSALQGRRRRHVAWHLAGHCACVSPASASECALCERQGRAVACV